MANVSLKKDFRDGDKLFAQQLNNNFGAIEAGMNSFNQVNWEDEATKVAFFKGTTEEVEERPISNGQLLYNTSTGETALDDNGERIVTGSGNVVAVGGEEPENPATKLWIEEYTFSTLGTEVVNTLEGNQTDKAPSVDAIKNYIENAVLKVYSTQEKIIGISENGNPVYIKTYKGRTEDALTTVFTREFSNKTIKIKNAYGSITKDGGGMVLGGYVNDNYYCGLFIHEQELQIYHSNFLRDADYEVTIEYTKNADERSVLDEI